MKKLLFSILVSCLMIPVFSQEYICPQITEDINKWNAIKNPNNNTKWAKAIRQNNLYTLSEDGGLEYVYILQCDQDVDIEVLRQLSFDYVMHYFNMDNGARADMIANSTETSVYFKGKLNRIGSYVGFGEYNCINADIVFDIRFKPNRIRFSAKILDYRVIKTSGASVLEDRVVVIKNTYPLFDLSDHKKSFAMAFINANSNCLNYANNYLEYINTNIKKIQQKIDEDW